MSWPLQPFMWEAARDHLADAAGKRSHSWIREIWSVSSSWKRTEQSRFALSSRNTGCPARDVHAAMLTRLTSLQPPQPRPAFSRVRYYLACYLRG